jgi:hypothetical protein
VAAQSYASKRSFAKHFCVGFAESAGLPTAALNLSQLCYTSAVDFGMVKPWLEEDGHAKDKEYCGMGM